MQKPFLLMLGMLVMGKSAAGAVLISKLQGQHAWHHREYSIPFKQALAQFVFVWALLPGACNYLLHHDQHMLLIFVLVVLNLQFGALTFPQQLQHSMSSINVGFKNAPNLLAGMAVWPSLILIFYCAFRPIGAAVYLLAFALAISWAWAMLRFGLPNVMAKPKVQTSVERQFQRKTKRVFIFQLEALLGFPLTPKGMAKPIGFFFMPLLFMFVVFHWQGSFNQMVGAGYVFAMLIPQTIALTARGRRVWPMAWLSWRRTRSQLWRDEERGFGLVLVVMTVLGGAIVLAVGGDQLNRTISAALLFVCGAAMLRYAMQCFDWLVLFGNKLNTGSFAISVVCIMPIWMVTTNIWTSANSYRIGMLTLCYAFAAIALGYAARRKALRLDLGEMRRLQMG
ncbi:hypothetical protein HQ393_09905 [Chitinibacter bivalviorum]|uniref:Uncharacterized protein n=1 Tax=Chitinibacter bivalviorum TaxID=2739434 RepID=A0A7H9BIQ6_9NEIS|nr:hypothetical protein [Chitinibacter bivalviorum]QLG88537.1 hypothetical protein HQ393_09905 [Chitinibacter bivalviorum]